ncbi:MAG: hypothetical protein AAGH53_08205 [Pseudomonadota bacterium]
MRHSRLVPLAFLCTATAMTITGCKQLDSDGSAEATQSESQDAEAEDENVNFSIEADGFSMDLDLPIDAISTEDANGRAEGLYPGSKVTGIAIESDSDGDGSQSQVAIKFTAPAGKEEVADWFLTQIPEDGGTAERKGAGVSGTTDDGQAYTLTLDESGAKTKGVLRVNTN